MNTCLGGWGRYLSCPVELLVGSKGNKGVQEKVFQPRLYAGSIRVIPELRRDCSVPAPRPAKHLQVYFGPHALWLQRACPIVLHGRSNVVIKLLGPVLA